MPKIVPVVLTLSLCVLPALAAEKPWPQKGHVVYVSAKLEFVIDMPPMGMSHHVVEPCTVLEVKKSKESILVAKDASGTKVKLKGAFADHLHHNTDACHAAFTQVGQPDIRSRSGWTQYLWFPPNTKE